MGIVYDMPFEEYHAVDAMSASGMRQFMRSPWHYRNRVQVVPTQAMLNGTLAHCAALEPHALADRYVVVPEDAPKRPTQAQWNAKAPSESSKAAMAWWSDFQASAARRQVVAAEDYAITLQQLEAIRRDPEISEWLSYGRSEVSIFWIDRVTGVYCKARPDHVNTRGGVRMLDLKAMVDDTPAAFQRSMSRLGYYRQQAHYMNGWQAVTGEPVDDFMFAVVSGVEPVLATAYRIVADALQQGQDEVEECLRSYAGCLAADQWPAYTPAERIVDLPAWAKRTGEVELSWSE
jgi:PDDEXK-like domain of unknown function (DUF3799)